MSSLLVGQKPVFEELQKQSPQIDRVYLAKNKKNIGKILTLCKKKNIPYKFINQEDLSKLFSGNHQGIIARLNLVNFLSVDDIFKFTLNSKFPLVLALDCVQDPQNVGSTIRTLVALGGGGIILPKNRSAFLGTGVEKSSAGAVFKAKIAKVTNLARTLELGKKYGYHVYATVPRKGKNPFVLNLNFPAILVLGNEEKGIRPGVLKRCDTKLTIPMLGKFESLNVSQAGAILMGEFLRQNSFI
ncbi:23S rRNA (guanosine(2251)-2'-O)-methyltransferase RlmB [Desulfonauticus submarinus]